MNEVYCPNCGREMRRGNRKVYYEYTTFHTFIDDDDSYHHINSGYIHTCDNCNIKYNSASEKYTIPKNIVQDITDKQKRCIGIICSNLKIDKPYIISKILASKFISNNIEKSKIIREENRYEYEDYDYYGFFGEEYY